MAKLIYTLPWTMQQLKTFCDGIVAAFSGTFLAWLNRMRTKPFIIVEDDKDKCKRIFLTQDDADAWFAAREDENMTPEIQALDFSGGTIPGTEQYKMSVNILNVDDADTYGKTAKLRFNFATVDTLNNNQPTEEAVEVHFTFTSDQGTKTDTRRFAYSASVTEVDITDFIEPDTNEITIVVRGLTSGLSVTARATYTAVYLPFSSSFDLNAARTVGTNFGIPYSVSGIGTKEVEFVIDGGTPFNDTVYDGSATKTYNFRNTLTAGEHTLQMKAYTTVGNKRFESDMLFFTFVVNGPGLNLTTVLISAIFPSGTAYFNQRTPGLIGEQYVDYTLHWAFFSTSMPSATVQWKTKLNGIETVVGSREIDEVQGNVGVSPEPIVFQPDTVGTYDLYAFIKGHEGTHIGEFTVNVSANSAGLREAEDAVFKIDAKGRSNDEPADTLYDWSNNGYETTFNSQMTFDGLAGYTGRAVRLDNGATALNYIKPFAQENNILTNGATLSLYFRTFNVEDETIPLIEIGDADAPSTAYFAVYGKKVLLRPSNGKTLEYQFASEEDTHLAVVINPKTGVTDPQMMFFIFNGIEAPGSPYGDTAVFNIGSTADNTDTNGMIRMGTETKKAAIDVYGIRVYNYPLSMWQGMNNYMIDKGGNVSAMMKKNNIFINNDFARPNITKIKEQYRVLEVIGNLGMLETSNKKENFFGSVRYTDPFNPKFSFYRLDGGAYIETAGQSRLEDLMAKSFHLDLNENDTVATYQDGKLCHKNRIIFAEGNIHENGVRIDLSGADSSLCRNASHMKMVNKYYPYINVGGEYILRTPPQRYAMTQWGADMAKLYGGSASDYPWKHNINFAPDSVPIVVVWHEKEDDPIQVYGLAQMTEEKKASYANGNHSIYLKPALSDGTFDPMDRFPGVKGTRGWNNDGVIEVEFVNPSDLTLSVNTIGFFNETTRDFSFELCYPKKKDLDDGGAATWQTFYDEFLVPLASTYNNQTLFNSKIEDIIYMPSFCMYYNKVMDKKCNDSLCRNMHVIRYNMGTEKNPKWQWWAKWWDVDVCCGLYQSNDMGVDPATDRNTQDGNGNYVMAGHDMWLWNALEQNTNFQTMCKTIAEASYAAGWSADTEIAAQDAITDSYSEGLYNLDQLLKFLYAYRKGNNYMIRMQGSSVPYRHGFIKESYNIREAKMAIGQYAARSASFRATNATYPSKVNITAAAHSWFGIGTTTTNIVTGVEKHPEDGEFSIQIPEGTTLGRDFLSVYGADKIRTLDISDFCKYLSVQINLGNLTQIQKLWIGYKSLARLAELGVNYDTTVSFTGTESMSRLTELSIMGLRGLSVFDISTLSHLTHFYAAATGLLNFRPANGTKFTTLELPDTLQTIECSNVKLGSLSFWQLATVPDASPSGSTVPDAATVTDASPSVTQMQSCPTSLLTLSIVGMGEDAGAHSLVHQWCQMLKSNPTLIQTAQITYRGINWTNIPKDDLFILAQIPAAQRNLTGYVFCNTIYTTAERTILTNAFGQNVFDPNSKSYNLVCDANGSGISLSGSGAGVTVIDETHVSIVQGTKVNLVGAGFPIASSNKSNYRYRVWQDSEWYMGTDDMPVFTFGDNNEISLNSLTGEILTTECASPEHTYKLGVYDTVTYSQGELYITVKPHTYPTKANTVLRSSQSAVSTVDGVMQITNKGGYLFAATNTDNNDNIVYTGTMTSCQWELVSDDGTAIPNTIYRDNGEEHGSANLFCLKIFVLPTEDLHLTLKYKSMWKNNTTLTATDIKMVVASVIDTLVIDDEANGNHPLFLALEQSGVSHAAQYFISSLEIKSLTGEFDASTALGDQARTLISLKSGMYFVPQYMKNVTDFTLSGTGLSGDIDISNLTWIHSLDLSDTYTRNVLGVSNKPSLSSLRLHVPTALSISNCPALTLTPATVPDASPSVS